MMERTTCAALLVAGTWLICPRAGADHLSRYIETKSVLERTRVAPASAVETAMRGTFGPTLVAAALQHQEQSAAYTVEFFIGLTLRTVSVDGVTGEIRSSSERAMNPRDETYRALREAATKIKTPVSKLIDAAVEEVPGGRLIRIEYQLERGQPAYEAELLAEGKLVTVLIDAVSGSVLDVNVDRAPDLTSAWSFDDRKLVGKLPDGWRVAQTTPAEPPARWEVIADSGAPSRPQVFSLTRSRSPEQTFNLAIAEWTSYKNVELKVQAKAVDGKTDQGGGLIWRCQDENNYYICRFNPLESNYRVYKVVGGKREQLASARVETQPGRWYRLRVVMLDDHILCYLDGQRLLDVRDSTFKDAGKIGLWTKADAVTSFDNLEVSAPRELPGP